MSLLDLPVNYMGAVFSFCWFMAGFRAAKSITELKGSSVPAVLKPYIMLFCPVLGFVGTILYFYFRYLRKHRPKSVSQAEKQVRRSLRRKRG